MDQPSFKVVGSPCGQHGQYTFYKALRLTGQRDRILAIGDFFFVRLWQDSELVSIGELQLLWRDRVSDQTLVSLRLYCLPENTPDGRNNHGEDEVLAINEKVVINAYDLMTWVCSPQGWRCGLKAVWRGECVPHADLQPSTPLHQTKLDFSDVDKEKSALPEDTESPGVVVFSYPRYCRYRALVARLAGVSSKWLRHSLVAALGGYAAETVNTRILYCKDTFEYPELEGHEFVCNHLAPRLKGRPRGRRRRPPRSRSHSPSSRSSDSGGEDRSEGYQPTRPIEPKAPRRFSLRNGASDRQSSEEEETKASKPSAKERAADRAFLKQLRVYSRTEPHSLRDLSLRTLYSKVSARGGYELVCKHKLWREVHSTEPAAVRHIYERFLLSYENQERRNGKHFRSNGKIDPRPIDTIDVPDSPPPPQPENLTTDRVTKSDDVPPKTPKNEDYFKFHDKGFDEQKYEEKTGDNKTNETDSIDLSLQRTEIEFQDVAKAEREIIKIDNETGEIKAENLKPLNPKEEPTDSKEAEELNKEFLDSLPPNEKPLKITLKPVEKLLDPNLKDNVIKLFEENNALVKELSEKHNQDSSKVIEEIGTKQLSDGSSMFLNELAQRLSLGNLDASASDLTKSQETANTLGLNRINGHTEHQNRPYGRSSLRHIRVKPTRPQVGGTTPTPLRPDSSGASSSPPSLPPTPVVTNMGIHHPPHSDDEIVEVPYKPKTPEIIDLDEYPESPQAFKKKKLDILKEKGLEVTVVPQVPTIWGTVPNPVPLITPSPIMLNPAMQHQIMTQASLFQMYNVIPQNYANGIQPPKVIQATCIYGSSGPEKTVYGNPKDPFMPPPHILHGAPLKPKAPVQENRPDILDLSKTVKPAVEIVRVPSASPKNAVNTQNLTQNLTKSPSYTLIDGKAVVGSNLEITLVSPSKSCSTPQKNQTQNRPPQKRSSNGKFMSTKPSSTSSTPPKETYREKSSLKISPTVKKTPINIPSYPIRDDPSPTSSTGSKDSTNTSMQAIQHLQNNLMKQNLAQNNLSQLMDMQKSLPMSPFIDPMYMSALYSSLAGQMGNMDHRQLALYRDFMANQFRGYTGLLGATPTTKH